jgi:hypothetical protein
MLREDLAATLRVGLLRVFEVGDEKRGGRGTRVCGCVIGQRIAQRWRFVFLERRAA